MKHNFFISLFFLQFIFLREIYTQVVDPSHSIIPPAPTAANLGKYGDIPVNLYTGIPEINIPIYTISGTRLNVPISLSYHAGGNRVDEIASWVGLGWSLNAGGVVTRTVYGKPDEKTGGYQQTIGTLPFPLSEIDDQDILSQIADGTKDAQPDEFYFNVNGLSGKFVIDGSGVVHTIPYMDILITPTFASGNITQFEIKASNGIIYLFSDAETTTPTAACGGDEVDDFGVYRSSWFLTSITSPNGEDVITFEYDTYSYNYTLNLSETKIVPYGGVTPCPSGGLTQVCTSVLSISGKRLNKITAINTVIEFEEKTTDRDDLDGDYALSKILIKDANNTLIKVFELETGYFSTGAGVLQNRLKLIKIWEEDDDNNQLPATEFTYYTTYNLPARNSEAQDHWGFYNGVSGNTTLIPTLDISCNRYEGANREPSEAYMKAGILEKIKYPTGGSTEFEFESNRYGYVRTVATTESDDIGAPTSKTALVVDVVNDDPPFDFDIESFTIDYIQNVTFETDIDVFPGEGGATFELRDEDNNIIDYDPPGCNYLTLEPGDYTIKVSAFGTVSHPTDASITVHYKTATNVYKNLIGGGLRIKKVTTKDNLTSNDIITKYEYQTSADGTRSSGVSGNKPDYYSNSERIVITTPPCQLVICVDYTITSSSMASLSAANGSPVVYKEVKTILGESGENGSSLNTFTYYPPAGGGFPYAPLENFDYKN